MTETVTSEYARNNWGDVVTSAIRGDVTIVERYNKPLAAIVPFDQWQEAQRLMKLAKIEAVIERDDFITEEEFERGLKERGLTQPL